VRTEGQSATVSLSQLYVPVAAELARCQRIIVDQLISDQPLISDLCAHVQRFRGKMLRPALLLLTGRACGRLRDEHCVLAALVELIHIATLVHDDVLDEADIRRRAATVNRLWGTQQAVLMGDFVYSQAYQLCSGMDSLHAARVIGKTAVTICEGEMMQVAQRGNYDISEDVYLDIITRKTAALVETSCYLGAYYAGADEQTVHRMRTFGLSLGIAFQIIDDLLDLTGDESQVGKSLGRDVSEGELTLPLIRCLASGSESEQRRLRKLLDGNGTTRHREIAAILHASECLDYAYDLARAHVDTARECLATLPDSPARESLSVMAEFVISRRR
jgi:octaprenyl-diphosphate synthase